MGNTITGTYNKDQPFLDHCVEYHSQNGLDYPWLEQQYGKLVKAEFSERGVDRWIDYKQLHETVPGGIMHTWWVEHCNTVNHDMNNLAYNHIQAFVAPDRFAIMRFTFANGAVYQSDINYQEFIHMYQLEQDYARNLYREAYRKKYGSYPSPSSPIFN